MLLSTSKNIKKHYVWIIARTVSDDPDEREIPTQKLLKQAAIKSEQFQTNQQRDPCTWEITTGMQEERVLSKTLSIVRSMMRSHAGSCSWIIQSSPRLMSAALLNNSADGWELQHHKKKSDVQLSDVTLWINYVINAIKRCGKTCQ